MEFSFDEVVDVMYIYLSRFPVKSSEQVSTSIIVDYNDQDVVRGIEILNFSNQELDLNLLIKMNQQELISNVVTI